MTGRTAEENELTAAAATAPTAAAPSAPDRRTVHVEHCMGTVFTIDIRDAGPWDEAVGEVVSWLHRVDETFSTYEPGSDVSRLRRRQLRLEDADPDVGAVLALCAELQSETGGFFSAMAGGSVDPTGAVKGWAIERASALLSRHGARNHAVNGGGDMQLTGEAAPGRPWRVGIADPADRSRVLAVVSGRDLAVATSGTGERGRHIIDPFTGAAAETPLTSASVVGPSVTRADAYATAAFVMGHNAVRWIADVDGYETLLVGTDGSILTSTGWGRYRGD